MFERESLVGLRFPSFYVEEFETAYQFYMAVFGKPETDLPALKGWNLGDTWLTLFPSKEGTEAGVNPRNAEFAIEVRRPEDVDRLHRALLDAGAKNGWDPRDTEMYVPMRFCFVDDPVGIRLDVYCFLDQTKSSTGG